MRTFALLSLFVLAFIVANRSTASAASLDFLSTHVSTSTSAQPALLASLDTQLVQPVAPIAEPPTNTPPPVQKYTVVENDTLSSISEHYQTTWQRLFNKNESIQNPDTLTVGEEIIIPDANEQLADRPLPQPIPTPTAPSAYAPTHSTQTPIRPASGAGNSYIYGYCTWYAKSRRPDLPNNLGNADTWVARAAAQGIPTGSAPRIGAIGQQGMHVVYVEAVNSDGTVILSEMNYEGYGVISSRTVSASYFMYIY